MESGFSEEELNEFKIEALELLDLGEQGLLALDNQGSYRENFDAIFRAFHSIKGAAGMMELLDLQAHMHQLESILIRVKDAPTLPRHLADLFLRGIDGARLILEGQKIQFDFNTDPGHVAPMQTAPIADQAPVAASPVAAIVAEVAVAPTPETVAQANAKNEETMQDLRESSAVEFFAECDEINTRLAADFEILIKSGSSPEIIASIYRDIHSLKGGAFLMGFGDIGDFAHNLETCLDYLRETNVTPSGPLIDVLFKSNDLIERMLKAVQNQTHEDFKKEVHALVPLLSSLLIETPILSKITQGEPMSTSPADTEISDAPQQPVATNAAPPAAPAADVHSDGDKADAGNSTIRVPVGLLDKLMTLVGEMVLVRNQVIQYSNQSDDLDFLNLSQRLNVVTGEIQGEMMKTRMQPIGNILGKFQRVVRDLSRELKKKIDLQIEGSETELDKTLLEAVKDPLTHIIRNSCDHGVETPEVRRAAGKPEGGTIRVRAFHEGGQVIVEIADDGKGLHRDKLVAKALERNLISKEKAASMSDRDAMNLIFAAGFSTAAQITNVSGRGVGMDVVRSNIDRIGGTVELDSVQGKGTTIRLKIPLTLAIVPAMIIRSGEDRYAIPQIKLAELVRVEKGATDGQIEYLQGQPVFRLRGNLLPLLDLKKVLQFKDHDTKKFVENADAVNIIVLYSERQSFGLIVDEIQDTADIVVKPLTRFLKSLAVYSGATVLGDGSVALILDIAGIAAQNLSTSQSEDAAANHSARSNDGASAMEESQEFLLFRLNSPTKHAVFLGYVHRLEEFKRSAIEVSGAQRVVRYRDAILPIYSLNDVLKYESDSKNLNDIVPVIVTQKGSQYFGIEVNEILDVFETSADIDASISDREGLIGNIVSDNEVVVVVDPHHCVPQKRNVSVVPAVRQFEASAMGAPVAMHAQAQHQQAPQEGYGFSHSKRLLFAEDTAFFRKHVSGVLSRSGYEVTLARNGEEALAILENRGGNYFEAVLSDIEMPKMNGYELAASIRKDARFKHMKVIALTTKASPKDREKGLESGFSAYLEKLNAEELLNTLEALTPTSNKSAAIAEKAAV